jgi:hypothetical protein
MPPPPARADPTFAIQPPRHPADPVAAQPVEHPTHDENGGLRDLERSHLAGSPPEQLRGDRRPRGVVVESGEVHAVQACPDARLDERSDGDPALGDDDRQMRHVPVQPRQVIRGRDHPVRDQHH